MSLNSYTPNYFSIDDILASQERCPCKFLVNVPKLGKLNPSAESNDLKPGTALELPMWLAEHLSAGRHPIIAVDLPRIYKEAYREILKADACAVDLHKLGLHFYNFGSYVKQFDARGDVSKALLETFQARFRQLMDLANNRGTDPTVQNRLDSLERKLLKDGHAARTRLNTWLTDSVTPIETAKMVVNHKKRKRVDLEDIM